MHTNSVTRLSIVLMAFGGAGCHGPTSSISDAATTFVHAAADEIADEKADAVPRDAAAGPREAAAGPRDDESPFDKVSIRGRVVWMAAALDRRHGVSTVPEAQQRILAIETTEGDVLPIVEDLRGRSFRTDERLRAMNVELLARRYHDIPMVQILKIHEIRDGQKFVVDYWCDVCSIVMFESGPCACCQDDNRLRTRPVTD